MALQVRDRRFDIDDTPVDWHPAGPAVTAFFDNLSLCFPAGERFFVASVKPYRHLIDGDFAPEVKAFCAQEAMHGREHVRYNAMLEAGGIDATGMERRVARLLRRVKKVTTPRWRLAVTCALEHYTATMGHLLLEHPALLDGAPAEMVALWRWHAAEETEHKAVAYEVYKAARGNYVERCAVMIATAVIFWLKIAEHQVRIMWRRRLLLSPRAWWQLGRWVWWRPGWAFKLIAMSARYFVPGFHPDDIDSAPLLEAWRAGD